MGALRARRRFAAITGSNFRMESFPMLASSLHVGATAAVIILQLSFLFEEWKINVIIRWLTIRPIRKRVE